MHRTDKGSSKKESFLRNEFGQVDFLFEQNPIPKHRRNDVTFFVVCLSFSETDVLSLKAGYVRRFQFCGRCARGDM
ncbi:hypothetical protein LEP1GSC060_3550 [Leptospira weilii serovar Ranarum str. ICFT]|uniref:Uncharacterized protein n=1 Tax=Leptospira weilii serovar Ranarum str. ICFT TaxID=1218598 RepID=N1WJG6_9LEPT|nr:hypothetical protein LEP1GSC060_3550 [Leptospira weilii serovar Ranarum str. ICFT]